MFPPSLADYAGCTERRAREQPATPHRASIVSIVTVTLNCAATIERTIRSVHAQSFSSIEHVFVDGGSRDSTVDIIRRLMRPQDFLLREKDHGISDAFNKGIALSRGQFVQILNADDWLSPDQIERGVATLHETQADFAFGDLIFYDEGKPIFRYSGDPNYAKAIHRRMPALNHPSVLAARRCFERVGLFDVAYRNAMDYDWLLRLHRADGRGVYCPAILGHMTHAGVSNRQFKRTIEEVKTIAVSHGRRRFLAVAEAQARYVKTLASHPIKQHARPLYRLIRRLINPSYEPAPSRR